MAIDPRILRNELDSLTHELGQLLQNAGIRHAGSNAKPVAEAIAAAFETLGDTPGDTDFHLERLIRARPILATAVAFGVGMTIGLLLRRT